jgi:hypothetical protein
MEKTSKPIAGGILNIITGALGFIGAIGMFIGFSVISGWWDIPGIWGIPWFAGAIVLSAAIPTAVLAILALIGGIYAVQRKMWGWALAGSIAAILVIFPLGIASTVLVAVAKDEF